jgi:hypothetical protein
MKAGQKQTRLSTLHLVLALGVVFLSSAVLQVMQPSTAMAATYSELSIAKRAEAWVMGRAVSECIDNRGFETNNKNGSDVNDGEWMWTKTGFDGSTDIGEWAADITEGNSDDSRANCKTAAAKTLQIIGVSGTEFICKTNELAGKEIWKRDNGDCRNGTGDYDFDEDNNNKKSSEIWNIFFRDWLGGNVEASLTRGMRYIIYSENFYQECSKDDGKGWNTPREWKSSDKEDNESDGKVYKLNGLLQLGSTADKEWYVVSGGNGGNHDVHIDGYKMLTGDDVLKCSTLADRINDNSGEYLKEVAQSTNEEDKEDSEGGVVTTSPEETTSCAIDGIGWIVCPAIRFIASVTDASYDVVAAMLTVQPLTTGDEGPYKAWEVMRNIANIAFVIAFLIIIYSQMTGTGVSNYGLKKMLPKLIIAAVLVNVSYWICTIAIDISNIVGTSLKSLLEGLNNDLFDPSSQDGNGGWSQLTTTVLTASVILYVGLSALLPLGVAALFAIVTTLIILTVRQGLLILLIVISPLAFVAYLLPNTEQWFKRWMSTFQVMLMLFPIVALIFGASSIAGTIITNSADAIENEGLQIATQLMGAGVTIIPLFILPLMMKAAGGLLGKVGAFVNNPNKGPFDKMRKSAEGYRGKRKNIMQARRLRGTSMFGSPGSKLRESDSRFKRGVGYAVGAPVSVASGLTGRKLTKEKQAASAEAAAKYAAEKYVAERAADETSGYANKIAGPTGDAKTARAYAIQTLAEEEAKDIKAAAAPISKLSNDKVAKMARTGMSLDGSRQLDEAELAAAQYRIMETGSFKERQQALEFLAENKSRLSADVRNEVVQRSIKRGDSNIYGAGFGNQIVDENGSIKDAKTLAQAAAENAAAGKVSAEHMVQNGASTKYLIDSAQGNAQALANIQTAANTARVQAGTASKVTAEFDTEFARVGSIAQQPGQQAPELIIPRGESTPGNKPNSPSQDQRNQGGNFNGFN